MSVPFPIKGPIAPETNPKINPQYFQPSRFNISAISLGLNTLITTSVNHNFVVGQEVRILITPYFGTYQLNQQQGLVISIPAPNKVTVNINSINYNAFIPTPAYGPTPPQIISIGEVNTGAINASGRTNQATAIPGSFINISPL